MERKLKPEAKCHVDPAMTRFDIEIAYQTNCTITGKVIDYNVDNQTLEVDLGNKIIGILPWEEVTIYDLTYPMLDEVASIPRQVISILYKNIRVKVTGVDGDYILLSRKKNMLEAYEEILVSSNRIFQGVIVGKYRAGVFFDIGEGITAFCHVTEFSVTRIENIGAWVSLGEQHIVQLLDEDTTDNYKFRCSRKSLCSTKNMYDAFKPGQIVIVKVSQPVYQCGILSGYFVELNPTVSGIADIFDEKHALRAGDNVTAVIKNVDPENKKIKLKIIA